MDFISLLSIDMNDDEKKTLRTQYPGWKNQKKTFDFNSFGRVRSMGSLKEVVNAEETDNFVDPL